VDGQQVLHEVDVVLGDGVVLFVPVGGTGGLEHVEHQHAVVGGEGASGFGDDVGMGERVLVGGVGDRVDHVVGVFLHRVVHGACRGGTRSVVVHAQASADVHEFHGNAHLAQLAVELRHFAQAALDLADVGDLAAQVEVDEFDTIRQAFGGGHLDGLDELRGVETELALVAARLLPLADPERRQLDAQPDVGAHVELARQTRDEGQFVELLDDQEDPLAHLLGQQRQLDEVLVLVAVAHDQGFGVVLDGQHGVEFGLGSRLEADVELLAVLHDLFQHRALLVDLDGVHVEVLGLEAVFLGGLLEAVEDLLDAVVEDVGESQQHRRREVAQFQVLHDLDEVDARDPSPSTGARSRAPCR
jgi:hypothetical protein